MTTPPPHPVPRSSSHAPHQDATVVRSAEDGATVITVSGHLEWDATVLAAQLRRPAATTVVDLSSLKWADSALLNTLLTAQRELRREERQLLLRGPLQPVVRRLFELTGVTSYFTFTPDVRGADGRIR
ncbi:STAS domain-containing protein [Streptomyces sp. NPDC088785]|uniref:STAS domain-containing protein n=1 Tax=Streptomyces sp. NPDC088785 TaxID=3365897 RepID=UPI003821015C